MIGIREGTTGFGSTYSMYSRLSKQTAINRRILHDNQVLRGRKKKRCPKWQRKAHDLCRWKLVPTWKNSRQRDTPVHHQHRMHVAERLAIAGVAN